MPQFDDLTLLVTHYNRSASLERLLQAFRTQEFEFGGIVVSDDGSNAEHLEYLESLTAVYGFDLVKTSKNKGLGHNINKGQDAVKTPYTLYVQEDFVPLPLFASKLAIALELMRANTAYDMARFYAYFKYPFLKPLRDGFSEINFNASPFYPGYKKFYAYSDHPHLRRSNFFERFGRYPEGRKGDVTEYRMMMSFLRHKGKAIFFDDFKALFDQVNSSAEPSTMKRNYLREGDNPLLKIARHLYRHVKLNLDYHLMK